MQPQRSAFLESVQDIDLEIKSYQKMTGAPADVARIELAKQDLLPEAELDAIRAEFDSRFAGLYWSDYPNQAINVRLTGQQSVVPRTLTTAAGPVKVIFYTGAAETLQQTRQRIDAAMDGLAQALPGMEGYGIDQRTGVVNIDIISVDGDAVVYEAERAAVEKLLGAPVKFTVSERSTERESGMMGGDAPSG
ncbi:hypothetical protein ABB29_03405 [Pseudoxanthomonas dokdonensis]|uniref:Uncharacterized protein n=2 Tax=Pseudoxanthomonas dokdonensis TaxID=344882 RepID=A0A0R0CYF2_9GAMM|nr:hypothetical protein ABB29_03405 [Pseudoxanthomonas dokdonensis]